MELPNSYYDETVTYCPLLFAPRQHTMQNQAFTLRLMSSLAYLYELMKFAMKAADIIFYGRRLYRH